MLRQQQALHTPNRFYLSVDVEEVMLTAEYHRSQIEPATAILCACLVTLRPLFVNLNLNRAHLSSRFPRTKSSSPSKTTNSTGLSEGSGTHLHWPGIRQSRLEPSARLSSGETSTKDSPYIVTSDLGTTDYRDPPRRS